MGNIQWNRIKKEIFAYSKNAFAEQNLNIQDNDIKECIEIFYNVITTIMGYAMLDGIGRELLPALQGSCCDNPGSLASFRAIKTSVDTILKRLLIATNKKTYSEVSGKGTKQLFVWTQIAPSYSMQSPYVTKAVVDSYDKNIDGLYLFAYTDYCRNEVHESPDIDMSDIALGLKHILAFYVFTIYKMKTDLLAKHPEFAEKTIYQIHDEKGERMYYEFINYGNSANALKNRFINSFVLEILYQSETHKADLVDKMLVFSRNSLKIQSAERILDKLKTNGRITYGHHGVVKLTENERSRLSDAYSNYAERISNFNTQLEHFKENWQLTCDTNVLFDTIKTFFENNFNTDFLEISDDISLQDPKDELHLLCNKLKFFGCSEEKLNDALGSLINICKSNDVLVRLGMGKLYSRISNPDAFESNAHEENRSVYVDTQIILYSLCLNMDFGTSENKRFISIKNLIDDVVGRKGANLLFARHYLSEVAYHLRQALLLIPFADRYNIITRPISTNVFYRYYFELKQNENLPEEINTYSDFLYEAFGLEETDAYSNEYWDFASSILEDKIYNEIGITVVDIPHYTEEQISKASDIFVHQYTDGNIKSGQILKNDAIMGVHLFNFPIDQHYPFFLTWDSSFSPFRKKYIEKYKKTKHLYWHLFSPMKFVNHIDLLNLNVDINRLSDDILTLIEADEYKKFTANIIDKFSKILDISGIDVNKRRRYVNIINDEVLNEADFPNVISSENVEIPSEILKVADLFDKVLDHYKDSGKESLIAYTSHILNEDYFTRLVGLIIEHAAKDEWKMDEFYNKVDVVTKEMFPEQESK